jgi:hypothetical protein
VSEQEVVLLAFRLDLGVNAGIERAYTQEQQENRAKLLAFARAVAEECAKTCEAFAANERSATAHHAGRWQEAYDCHLTRHAAVADLAAAIRVKFGQEVPVPPETTTAR